MQERVTCHNLRGSSLVSLGHSALPCQPKQGQLCHLSAVIPHFEDGCLPADLLAISLLPAALILSVRAALQTWVGEGCSLSA